MTYCNIIYTAVGICHDRHNIQYYTYKFHVYTPENKQCTVIIHNTP